MWKTTEVDDAQRSKLVIKKTSFLFWSLVLVSLVPHLNAMLILFLARNQATEI